MNTCVVAGAGGSTSLAPPNDTALVDLQTYEVHRVSEIDGADFTATASNRIDDKSLAGLANVPPQSATQFTDRLAAPCEKYYYKVVPRDRPVDRRGMGHSGPFWTPISGADLRASTASPLFNVDCVGAEATPGPEIVFLPNGAVARNPDCSDPTTDLDFVDGSGNELLPEVIVATDNPIIRFNRYAIRVQPSGNVVVVPGKE